jgi:hypothetical protein
MLEGVRDANRIPAALAAGSGHAAEPLRPGLALPNPSDEAAV